MLVSLGEGIEVVVPGSLHWTEFVIFFFLLFFVPASSRFLGWAFGL